MSTRKSGYDIQENLKTMSNLIELNVNEQNYSVLNNTDSFRLFTELEDIIGYSLPDDFKELYLWHNELDCRENIGSLFLGMNILPIEQLVKEYDNNFNLYNLDFKGKDVIKLNPEFNKRKWIVFGYNETNKNLLLCLDLSPSSKGCTGQVLIVDDKLLQVTVISKSITEFVAISANVFKITGNLQKEFDKVTLGRTLLVVVILLGASVMFFNKFQTNRVGLIINHIFVLQASQAKIFYLVMSVICLIFNILIIWIYLKMKKLRSENNKA